MSDLPELIVDGDPADWLPWRGEVYPDPPADHLPERHTVRVDSPLPPVWGGTAELSRPLRADDRVTLATNCDCGDAQAAATGAPRCFKTNPFATATVTQTFQVFSDDGAHSFWLVTVADVEAL